MLRSLILISIIALVSACASNPSSNGSPTQATQQVAPTDSPQTLAVEDVAAPDEMPIPDQVVMSDESDIVCTRKPVTGSRIGVKRCYSKKQMEAEREQTQDSIIRAKARPRATHISQTGPRPGKPGGP